MYYTTLTMTAEVKQNSLIIHEGGHFCDELLLNMSLARFVRFGYQLWYECLDVAHCRQDWGWSHWSNHCCWNPGQEWK